ncbi:LysM domain containing protein [Klebsormidium nitens]|uniref:LysM domain containing protein n=1 Tax=Klebsormidium nitens TaxID=105231 RepID=A0A1Y1I5B5_KLENI|nr:LysM domain containing protein [Klebsormidium nitens]|eukprot:GAQ86140.1 LysM domain containing protein [Klebsormidium nitens]
MASALLSSAPLHAASFFQVQTATSSTRTSPVRQLPPSNRFLITQLPQRALRTLSRPSVRQGVVCMATREEEKREGPHRFLRFAAGAGAATAAIGAAAWAVRKHGEESSHHVIDEAIAAGAPPSAAAGGLGEGGSRGYTVQHGDTLTKIADRLGAPISVIMEANRLKDDRVYAGQQLWVPKTYTIRPGDTLSKIAREFSTSIDVLSKMNGIKDPDFIFADDVLLLP